ncbi:MAG: DUF2284 domain-containing protein [Syntrophorhabdales bacterium]|jgi:predicted metal-binding protein
MIRREELEDLFSLHGFTDFKWIKAGDIRTGQWVRFKCLFGCPVYGTRASCPPNVPSVEECREFLSEYDDVAIFHFEKSFASTKRGDRASWGRELAARLLTLERDVFLAGYYKAFLVSFQACARCDECAGNRLDCKDRKSSRPGADALGIDVYATARGVGYPIQPLKDYDETMNRYAFLLIE